MIRFMVKVDEFPIKYHDLIQQLKKAKLENRLDDRLKEYINVDDE